ncbi:hypothetical protein QBC37DRAFT_278240 [Rhypophila decipiens]|uniref:Uncharacterized protein n=1 Tax=Rhypophila decipiens TaxID=261697 RepID=A0AAN6YIW0_9PEZI|nr:hypothetical protein QBC37DRAFT_278240 [Rhypophila decipiens]
MKATSLIIILAAAASSTASPIHERGDPPHFKKLLREVPSFQVTNFTATAIILSHRVYYGFNLIVEPGTPLLYCQILGTTGSESLDTIRETYCSNTTLFGDDDVSEPLRKRAFYPDPDALNSPTGLVSFQWKYPGPGADTLEEDTISDTPAKLIIIRQLAGGKNGENITDEGVYVVPGSDIPVLGTGMFRHQVYTGPRNFTVDAFRFLTI